MTNNFPHSPSASQPLLVSVYIILGFRNVVLRLLTIELNGRNQNLTENNIKIKINYDYLYFMNLASFFFYQDSHYCSFLGESNVENLKVPHYQVQMVLHVTIG